MSLAGCSSETDDDNAVELLSVGVLNWTEKSKTLQVRVERDSETVADSTYELEADGQVALECTWPSEPGDFVVSARVGTDGEWTESDMTALDADCVWPLVVVRSPASISMPTDTDCTPSETAC
jgi:hypothetical protein